MRIVQMIDNLHLGGAQKMQIILAEAMYKRDIELALISLDNDIPDTAFPEQLKQFNVALHYFPSSKLLSIKRMHQITNFLKKERFDLLHAHLTYANIIGTITGRMAGIPTIASFRNVSVDTNWVRAQLEAFLLRNVTTRLMAVGHETAAAQQHRVGKKPIMAIPNSVSLIPPLPAKKRLDLRKDLVGDPTRPIIIAVGRLMPHKDFDTLLEAFAIVHKQHPNLTLLIVGTGELHNYLTDQIKRLNLVNHVKLLGFRADIPDLLAMSDIYVSSSLWEGLSNALLEAMAAGLPVIATDNGDTSRVVIDGTGLLFPAQDVAALTDSIKTLLDPEKRRNIGAAARQHMSDEYNVEGWTEQILTIWQRTLKSYQE